MWYYYGLFSIMIALFFTAIFSYGFKNKGPWNNAWSFFLILFLAVWAGGIWITPFGPEWKNVAFAPLIVMGVFIATLLAATTPPEKRKVILEEKANIPNAYEKSILVIGVFFWILIILLIGAILLNYFT